MVPNKRNGCRKSSHRTFNFTSLLPLEKKKPFFLTLRERNYQFSLNFYVNFPTKQFLFNTEFEKKFRLFSIFRGVIRSSQLRNLMPILLYHAKKIFSMKQYLPREKLNESVKTFNFFAVITRIRQFF